MFLPRGLSSCFGSFIQVSSIYKDPSIGNLINIVIVKLVIINNELVRLLNLSSIVSILAHLQQICDVLMNEITPFIISLCMFLRMVQSFHLMHRPL